MLRKTWTGLMAGAALAVVGSVPAQSQELTIFWAQWDPANYLQELVNEYTAESGVTVTVEQTSWDDFQTKTFAEFNAKGDAYDIVVGDSQWLGAGSTGGHYVDLTDWIKENGVLESMAPATMTAYSEYPKGSGTYWAIPTEGDATGWAYRTDWFSDSAEQAAFKAKYGYDLAVPQTWDQLRDIAEFFHRPDQQRYGIAIYTWNPYDALIMGYENALFSYGGDLGNYETYEVEGIVNSPEAVAALDMYRALYAFTPPNWGSAFFIEDNQAITEGLVAMSMNYFAFFPALANEATNPHAAVTGYFANPAGPSGAQHAALGGQGMSIVSYSSKQDEAKKFLTWFVREDVQKRWGELGGYTCNAKVLESAEFRNATPYNEAFYQTMFMVKDFWAVPEYAELLEQMKNRIGPFVVNGEGTAQGALDGVAADWTATFKKYGRLQ